MTAFDYDLDIGLPLRLRNLTSKLVEFSSSAAWQFAPFKDDPTAVNAGGKLKATTVIIANSE